MKIKEEMKAGNNLAYFLRQNCKADLKSRIIKTL